MQSYVKFLRGTFKEFNSLNIKDSDTLYFVYSEDNASSALYLGERLISGTGVIEGPSNLSELNDVIVDSIGNKHILQYNGMKWVNISLNDLISQLDLSSFEQYINAVSSDFSVENGQLKLISIPKDINLSENDFIKNLSKDIDNLSTNVSDIENILNGETFIRRTEYENELAQIKEAITWKSI